MIVAPLVAKQRRSFELATARINIWEGSVSSSKTIVSLLKWLQYVREAPPGPLLMVAKTERTLKRNIIDVLISMLGKRRCRFVAGSGELHLLGRLVYVAGANNELAVDKIRGLSLAGAYLDEASTVPETFWSMLLTRLRIPGARLFCTSNPDGPAHWLLKNYLTRASMHLTREHAIRTRSDTDALDLHRFSFAMTDNPTLDPGYIRSTEAEMSGLFYRRNVLGEWCLAEGVVYAKWNPSKHVVPAEKLPTITEQLALAIDHGTTNPLHAILLGLGADGRLYVTHEWRWDHTQHLEGQLTDVEYSQRLRAWAAKNSLAPKWRVVDPSAEGFNLQLHRDGWPTFDADNEVVPGIQQVASLFATDRLLISDQCPELIAEIPGYCWDTKASEKGEDKPIKVADHGVDALRYGVHTTEPLWFSKLTTELSLAA